jgi:hypothetical protein
VNFSNANNLTNKKVVTQKKTGVIFFGGNSGSKTSNQKPKDISSLPLPSLPSFLPPPLTNVLCHTSLFLIPSNFARPERPKTISYILYREGEREKERERERER